MKKYLTIFILSLSYFVAFSQSPGAKPFILGEIVEIKSGILGETRTLNIYLPPDYNPTDTAHYAVAYLLDGSADEDFIHIAGLIQFNTFEWVNRMPKTILVGIANVDRRRDFTFPSTVESELKNYPTTGHSDKFIAFIEKELQPFIEKNYKTNSIKTLIGESLGGLLATEILLTKPALFNKYIIVSPSLWWDNGSILNRDSEIFKATFSQNIEIYMGVGKEGLTPTDIPRIMEVDANVMADKIKSTMSNSVTVYFDYLPDEDHATIMHQAVSNAFRVMYLVN